MELLKAGLAIDLKTLSKIGRTLSMQMALESDSSAFNHFFIHDILPRYSKSIPSKSFIELSHDLELFEETEDFLSNLVFEQLPIKRKTTKTSTTSSVKQSPLRRSPRFIGTEVGYKEKHVKPVKLERNLSRNSVKKQVNVRSIKSVLNLTPEPATTQISAHAKNLQEFTQTHFYDRKKEEVRENEAMVLVTSTPTKQEHAEYEVRQFKSLFND